MSDIFISYARSTEAVAKAAADSLRQAGFRVWRDDELPAHRSYSEVIEERLQNAKAVLVLWSAEAVRSQWVRAEADIAREAGTLVQMSVDGTTPPIPFNQIQCADLADWSGNADHAGWKKILDSIGSLVGPSVAASAPAAERPKSDRKRIIVLPFQNMSGDSEQEYFSDGISEDIITDLAKVSALDVVSRNQAFSLKGKTIEIDRLGEDMSVSHVVEGSVRKAGGRVRITAQLTDAENCNQIWAERYDRELQDIFALQDEISKAIVAALRLNLLPKEKKAIEERGTTNSDAYNLYLKARQQWITSNDSDSGPLDTVIRISRQATAIDPDYAKAWGLMALAQARLIVTFNRSVDARSAAKTALSIDPDLPEARLALALLAAGDSDFEEANKDIAAALAVDPESFEVNKVAARIFFQQGELDKAIEHYEKAVVMVDGDYHASGMLLTCYEAKGDAENSKRMATMTVDRCKAALEKDPGNGGAYGMGAGGLAVLGRADEAREWTRKALLIDPENQSMRYNLACNLTRSLHDDDGAMEILEPLFKETGTALLVHAEADPDLDRIRDNPRFQKMLSDAKARAAGE